MKKSLTIIIIAASLYACGNGAGNTNSKKDPADDPNYKAGMALVNNSGCPVCHKVDEVVTGPSLRSIASKYPYNVESFEMLSTKIIKGGSGNWGQIPMIPHPNISGEDAIKMVKYILLLKNN
jgi:cytochrome c